MKRFVSFLFLFLFGACSFIYAQPTVTDPLGITPENEEYLTNKRVQL